MPSDNQNYRHNAKTHAVAFDDGHSGVLRKRLGGLCGHNNAFGNFWGPRRVLICGGSGAVSAFCDLVADATAFTNACKSTS